MAAANAQIGIAVSAFFPSLTLSGDVSYSSSGLRGLLAASNGVWAVGPQLAATLFDVEGRRAAVRQARAAYAQAIDNYRQTVLRASSRSKTICWRCGSWSTRPPSSSAQSPPQGRPRS